MIFMKSAKVSFDFSDQPEIAEHLRLLSARRQTTQKAIVVEALQQYFSRLRGDEFIAVAADLAFSEWDNPDDADYDKI
jgi:hypothetical protein